MKPLACGGATVYLVLLATLLLGRPAAALAAVEDAPSGVHVEGASDRCHVALARV